LRHEPRYVFGLKDFRNLKGIFHFV
jgi:hypothetical protein